MTSPLDLPSAHRAALFASTLQSSQRPSAAQVRTAITEATRQYGARTCLERMAQEFGDHPDTATTRMRWVNEAVEEAYSRPTKNRLVRHSFHGPARPVANRKEMRRKLSTSEA